MLIADSQVHIWTHNTPERPWRPGQNVHREKPLEADEVLREMNAAGVYRTVLVPPSLDADRNDLALAAARRHPDLYAVMGRLDPDAPGARGMVASWRQQTGMLGLRYSLNRPQWIPLLQEGRVDWLWEEAEKASLPDSTPHGLAEGLSVKDNARQLSEIDCRAIDHHLGQSISSIQSFRDRTTDDRGQCKLPDWWRCCSHP